MMRHLQISSKLIKKYGPIDGDSTRMGARKSHDSHEQLGSQGCIFFDMVGVWQPGLTQLFRMFVCYYYWVIVYVSLGIRLNSCIDPIYIDIDNRITQLLLTIIIYCWVCPNIQ